VFSQATGLGDQFTEVYTCNSSSCTPTAVWSGSSVTAMVSDATSAYWSAGNTVYRCASTGCSSGTSVATASSTIVSMALDSTQLFFSDGGTIYRLAR
jgi:hypothetical protein